jgi:hypothetical protein
MDILFISVFNLGCIDIAENHIISLLRSGITNYRAYVTDTEGFDILRRDTMLYTTLSNSLLKK